MLRREFGKASLGVIASTALINSAKGAKVAANDFPKSLGLTDYVGRFVTTTKYEHIPPEVIELGKKSILDGLGLALAGSMARTGTICRQYLESLGLCDGKATIVGSAWKTSSRFAAFVNAVSIHADDFDDTQLAVAKDRVYGLLVHPTVPVLPATLALAERGGVRKAASLRCFKNAKRVRSGCQPVRGPERKLWHHDQAFPGRARSRMRAGVGRTCGTRLVCSGANSRRGS